MKAVVFDFDGTLTPDEAPKFEILEKSGMQRGVTNSEFLRQVRELVEYDKINFYEAFIKVILKIVSNAGFELTDENIGLGANKRVYNPGVVEFLQTLNKSGIKTYILSSGSKAYLKQTEIAPLFTDIFASTLTYGEDGKANGIETVMSVEQKAKTLRDLACELNGDDGDCHGIVYFGDGPTDKDAFEFVKKCGGKTVLVHGENQEPAKETLEMIESGLIDLFAVADYSKSSEIYNYILDFVG